MQKKSIKLGNCLKYLTDFAKLGHLESKFYLQYGQSYTPCSASSHGGEPIGICYQNAGLLSLRTSLNYCEGYAFKPGLFPLHHAWCVTPEKKVVDPTWEFADSVEYFGIEINKKFMLERVLSKKVWGVLAGSLPPDLALLPPSAWLASPPYSAK